MTRGTLPTYTYRIVSSTSVASSALRQRAAAGVPLRGGFTERAETELRPSSHTRWAISVNEKPWCVRHVTLAIVHASIAAVGALPGVSWSPCEPRRRSSSAASYMGRPWRQLSATYSWNEPMPERA